MKGKTVSHYKILEKIGEGGMGVVNKAQDTKLDRIVALKFLPQRFASDSAGKERFFQEAKAVSSLNHPNILTIHDINDYKGQLYIVMEYIEGETIKSKIQNKKLKDNEIVDFGLQIGRGLRAAHEKGVIHRDLKSENLMLTIDGRVKIMDFGLAKLKGRKDLTRTKTTVGTLSYMSPEQIQGAELDQRTDLWSLGVVLYEMLFGQLPFKGDYEASIMYSILNEEPDYPEIQSCNLSRPLQEIIKKALQKDLKQRYQKVEEVITDLDLIGQRRQQPQLFSSPLLKSIAVLPFYNISPDKENEYFSDGLTDEIITNLSKIRSLRVISRTSTMRFRGAKRPLKQIARELGVHYILEGSVRKHQNDLRITAQLVDANQDVHLWAERYKGTIQDVFDIQEKVASEIVGALKIQITPEEQKGLKKRYTEDTEAYQNYLKGRYYWNKRSEEGFKKGINYFNQTIEKDPLYALAYVGLADAYILLGVYSHLSPNHTMPKAKVAILRALELDDLLGEGHASLAHLKLLYDWDWVGAEQEFRKAIDLNPGYAPAHLWYTVFLSWTGRLAEAMAEIMKAQELDPLSLIINTDIGLIHYLAGRYDQAIEQYQRTLEIDPNFFVTRLALSGAYEQKGRFPEAINELQQALTLSNESTLVLATLGRVYAMSGKREEAQNILTSLIGVSQHKYVSPYIMARLYLALGEIDSGFEWLYKAYMEKSLFLVHTPFNVDPCFKGLNSDSRFTELIRKVGLDK